MSMRPFTQVTGPAAALLRANVDTDVIIRIEHLTQPSREVLGRYALQALRYLSDGSENPEFVLNQPAFRGAPILLCGANFGCGSSREHAVWALQGIGIRCVVAPSFGEIFFANCFHNGLLPIRLPAAIVDALAVQCSRGEALTIDLQQCRIIAPGGEVMPFEVDAHRREMLLHAIGDIELTLRDAQAIQRWQAADRVTRPWVWAGMAAP
jgi:3-isopropylmalate/(R)-2-methylmalate dehydratase small subunit